jgi:hypothetical protein
MKYSRRQYDKAMQTLQQKHERLIRAAANRWLNFSNQEIQRGVNRRLIRKDIAHDIVVELTDWTAIEEEGQILIKPALLRAIAEAGQTTYDVAGVKAKWDMVRVEAVELAQTITANMVREVTEETKAAIRWVIGDSITRGDSMRMVGKRVKPLVGLTERQVKSVANYEEKLLTDDRAYSRAQIDRKVASYEKRLHRKRTETIARTETSEAVSEASLQAYEAAEINVEWITRGDEACDICAPRDGEIMTVAEARGQIPAHPNCICGWGPAVAVAA